MAALLNLLLISSISFHLLLFVSALSDDRVSNIKVKYNGKNSPRCLTGNGTACQSLDYVFKNLHSVQAQTVIVSIASPQVVTVKSTVTSDGTTALTLLGANEDSSSRSDRISINFNMIKFNFPSINVTLQGLEIVDAGSLIFNGVADTMIDDCLLTHVDYLAILPGYFQPPPHPTLTLNNTLVHDTKFDSRGFLYYNPISYARFRYYYLYIYLYNTNFTKNTGKIFAMAAKSVWGYSSEIQVENCIFSGNIEADIGITITTASTYSLNINFINTTFKDNTNSSVIVSLNPNSGYLGLNLIGLNIKNNTNMILQTGGIILKGTMQLSDSLITGNDGLVLAMNSSLDIYRHSNMTLQVSNVQFAENKRWFLNVDPQTTLNITNCVFTP